MQSIDDLKTWIRNSVPDNLGILIPISGGSDSALCFWLYSQVFPGRVVGLYFGTELRSEAWFRSLGEVRVLAPLPDLLDDPEILRWASLLKIALQEQRVLIGARNKTEHILGSFSHASRTAFHLPLSGLWKSQIFSLCEAIGVPEEILSSSRAADLVCGRAEEYVQIPFQHIDAFLQEKIGEAPMADVRLLTEEQRTYLETLYRRSSYKRELPLSL